MGTETIGYTALLSSSLYRHVKLNNPLMGTETFSSRPFSLSNAISIVKLNNPLMGTETFFFNFNSR